MRGRVGQAIGGKAALLQAQRIAAAAQLQVLLGDQRSRRRCAAGCRAGSWRSPTAADRRAARRRSRALPRPTRPRSWCSWARPKRSACSITMIVAAGTSTPTSTTVVATSTASRALGELGHHPVLLGRRQLAVHQADLGAEHLPQRRRARLGGGQVGGLGLRDQRADPERLGAGRRPRSAAARRSRRPAASARRGWRPACGRAASRRCARRRGRRTRSAPGCAGSAWPTWPAGARPRPWPAAGCAR